jgi:hypothetical protein
MRSYDLFENDSYKKNKIDFYELALKGHEHNLLRPYPNLLSPLASIVDVFLQPVINVFSTAGFALLTAGAFFNALDALLESMVFATDMNVSGHLNLFGEAISCTAISAVNVLVSPATAAIGFFSRGIATVYDSTDDYDSRTGLAST